MDPITQELTSLILKTDVTRRPDLAEAGRRAFADYLASALAGSREEAVRRTASFLATHKGERDILGFDVRTTPENAAFFNGFASHYLDFDDAEANLMGHFSTVIFSALLAIADPSDTFEDFLAGYTAGAETEGLLGKLVNPAHKKRGYHPTATIGPIGAAAAIARFRRLPLKEASELLSLGATESAGLGLEAGTDTKPLHSGFAARNAVFPYFLIRDCALTSSTSAFNNDDGWAAVTAGKTIAEGALSKRWLSPGELISPGLWMKKHQYCSAAIPGAAALKSLWKKGVTLDVISKVIFHFSPGKSYSLHYHAPKTGQQGRFSMEYVAWQILTKGDVDDDLFRLAKTPAAFIRALPKFGIKEDLPPAGQEVRRIVVTADTKDGRHFTEEILKPDGSPDHPFTKGDLTKKLAAASDEAYAEEMITLLSGRPSMKELLSLLSEAPRHV